MRDKIKLIIGQEDKRNPLTDEVIANELGTLRENITKVRIETGIPASSERRKERLLQEIQDLFNEIGLVSDRKLAELLKQRGFKIGKFTVGQLHKSYPELWEPVIRYSQDETSVSDNKQEFQDDIFDKIIGSDGSLKNQISKAKAAVMYPPKGLHTLLYGPSGVGKSFLAELMHDFAVRTDNFQKEAPYFEFNCADYADNPQLLLAQLFGYTKGAFTGATEHKKGIVELCDGGILFLDEVHRLPAEGQEILFYLMDKGRFRRLGEAETSRESHPLIIAATTEDPESSLLLTFRRRIPMSIEIPALTERPLEEKWLFIELYLTMERERLGRDIRVNQSVLNCLLLAEFPGNIGQLKSDIQVCCAKAFLEAKLHNKTAIEVVADNLPEYLKSYINQSIPNDIRHLISGDVLFSEAGYQQFSGRLHKMSGTGIYEQLEERYTKLLKNGIAAEEISRILQDEVETTLVQQIRKMEESKFSLHELSAIVGEDVLEITEYIYQEAKEELPGLKDAIIFPMAIHIRASLDMTKERKVALGSSFEEIKKRHAKEYQVAAHIIDKVNYKFYVMLPADEAVFLAMYLSKFQGGQVDTEGKTSVIVLSHGRVAGGMAEVANKILGVNHATALEMALSEDPAAAYERTKQLVIGKNQGRGCILLADMGSLLTFAEKIRQETKIPVAICGRVDTLMVIECLHKVLWTEDSIETIVDELGSKKALQPKTTKYNKIQHKRAVLCLCITGQGAAKVLRNFISERLKSVLDNIVIINRGYIENEDVEQIILQEAAQYEILAIVGTINPEVKDIPFLSLDDIYQSSGISKLRKIIKNSLLLDHVILGEVITPELIFVNPPYRLKEQLLDQAIEMMTNKGYVDERFLLSVYKREGMMTTYLKGGIAIPHGDPASVTKPVISITKLDKPVMWDGTNTVDLIFVLALDENSKKYFEQLYQMLSSENLVSLIRNSNSINEIRENLRLDTKPVN